MASDVVTADFKPTPYWWDLAPRPEPTEAGPPAEAEVVIVGAGNVGLSAALTLARRGREAVVLDAEAAGHGASTRNAGYLGRQVWHKYGEMVPKLGRERAAEVCRAAIAAHDFAASLIEKEQIACFYRNTGRFIAAPSKRVFDGLARDLAMMREDGVPVDAEMVEPEAAPTVYRKGRYHGGQILRGNGTIHPGLYHAGLLERAARDGAQIVSHCPVQAIERAGSGFRISTPRGTVRAGHVIVATNGYTPKAARWLRRRVVPVDAFMIATEPLPSERVEEIAPGARPMLEHRYSPCWLRPQRGRHADSLRRAQRRAACRPRTQGTHPARCHGAHRAGAGRREYQPLLDRQDRLHLRHDAPHREPRRRRVRHGLVRVRRPHGHLSRPQDRAPGAGRPGS